MRTSTTARSGGTTRPAAIGRVAWVTWAVGLLLLAGCQAPSGDGPEASEASPSGTSGSSAAVPSEAASAGAGAARSTAPSGDGAPTTPSQALPTESITVPELPTARDRGLVLGGDVSWPQCPRGMGIPQKRSHGAPMPVPEVEYVILGLTNGPGFYPNPCLAEQVAWVRERHLMAAAYAVVSYPEQRHLEAHADDGPFDASTASGRLSNVGYAQAMYNVESMRNAGLESPVVWLDVEPVPDFAWSRDPEANAAVVQGARRAYEDEGYAVGVYSTAYMWEEIVGDLRLGLPEWRPAGQTSREEALRRCGEESMFQGGHAVLAQWVEADRDMNITCPGTSTFLEVWFHQY